VRRLPVSAGRREAPLPARPDRQWPRDALPRPGRHTVRPGRHTARPGNGIGYLARMHTTEPVAYDPQAVEARWQAAWAERGTNRVDLQHGERPFYALMMFPYPSAEGLHVGNLFAFTGSDISARYHRLLGHAVFQPLGYDAFGIHSENYALKVGAHPMELTPKNVANFRRQLERAGLMVDWQQQVDTSQRDYYRWTQWVFLQLYKQGLAYKKAAAVNWCPSCKTVLANEQVEGGACERCGTTVEQRFLEQWFFRISDYAGRLLDNLETLDWSDVTRSAQRNWIGRSEGAELTFRVDGRDEQVRVFTTRPDTIFGATYLVLAPEHPLVDALTTSERAADVQAYRDRTTKQDLVSRKSVTEKTGEFTGSWAINPATGKRVPIWIADYVLMQYGTGAIMAVPGHDERDFEFAAVLGAQFSSQCGLARTDVIVRVVAGGDDTADTPLDAAFTDDAQARLVNSQQFDGTPVREAKAKVTSWLQSQGCAEPVVNYRLHDWCVSRQRYWGPPIPIVYCDTCGTVPVPEEQLPVELPFLADFKPDDSGVSPLARDAAWYNVPCPSCGGDARRETDVSDTFLDSAWYFLRYPSARRDDAAFDAELTKKWLPVNSYIGGNEHAVLHLLYSRFVTMALKDGGHLHFDEPFTRFRAHGLIIRDGAKMSKTKGNVINPDEYIAEWGADSFRTYLMFLGPYQEGGDFRSQGISGVRRFLDRLWSAVRDAQRDGSPEVEVMRKLHQTIRKVGDDIAVLAYNTAIAAMMEYMNVLRRAERQVHVDEVAPLVSLVAPFAPHLAEECWAQLGRSGSVFDGGWPQWDAALVEETTVEVAVQVSGKTRGRVSVAKDATQDAVVAAAMADATIAKFVTGELKKVVYVPGRLLSLVV
jgi:leucyl-tRNA synthetase